ncbi:transcription factor bHLH162-like [Vicia villosa]|uniref:transcription factor bHLH162-like n=1 Tax=Vicia villosa TaxID=3911 RepID=UPI00273BC83D|nr:transcription factor bHLH162-like [Vicia villosa]
MDPYQQAGQPSSSTKVERKIIEKNRRNKMKNLHSKLNSLLPNYNPKETLPLIDQVDDAINYIKSLETNLKLAKEKKERLMRSKRSRSGCLSSSGAKGSVKSPKIEIDENGSSLQVIVTCGVDEQFIFYEILRILQEDHVEVISANSSSIGDSVIHVVHAEILQSLLQFGATNIGERLKKLVNGSTRVVQLTEPQLWDFEIRNENWDLNSIVNQCLPNS